MLIRNISLATAVLALTLGIGGCSKEGKDTTHLKINLTDNPYNATEVNVDIREVRVNFHDDDNGWVDISTNPGVYNLLDLQNGVDTLLAQGTVPTGTLKQVRFVLGDDNSIKIDNNLYP